MPNPNTSKSVALDIETYELLKHMANEEFRTLAGQIRWLMKQAGLPVRPVDAEPKAIGVQPIRRGPGRPRKNPEPLAHIIRDQIKKPLDLGLDIPIAPVSPHVDKRLRKGTRLLVWSASAEILVRMLRKREWVRSCDFADLPLQDPAKQIHAMLKSGWIGTNPDHPRQSPKLYALTLQGKRRAEKIQQIRVKEEQAHGISA